MKKGYNVFAAILLLSLSLTAACSGRTAAQQTDASETESKNLSSSASVTETETTSDTGSEPETEASSEAGSEPAPASSAAAASEAPHADVFLTAPPEISLSDSLSSANTSFTLHSGTGEWSWADKDEITTSVACGSAPLDMDPEQAATLDVPDYNRLDSVPYLLSCVVLPDRILLREWGIQDLGVADAEPLSETEYSEVLPIELKKDRVRCV